jgi:filamentous hemagglutinin
MAAVNAAATVAAGVAGAGVTASLASSGAAVGSSSTGASSAANGVRLNVQLSSQEIAGGHAFTKHASELGLTTRTEFAAQAESIMSHSSNVKFLSSGRTAYWDNATQSVVIRNPAAVDGGTMFKPTAGKQYFDNLK